MRILPLAAASGLVIALATGSLLGVSAQGIPPKPPGDGWVRAYNYLAGGLIHTEWIRLRARRGPYVTVEETWSDGNGHVSSDSKWNTNSLYDCNSFKARYLGTNAYPRANTDWEVVVPGTKGESEYDAACRLF